MLKILVCGISGKMGGNILRLAAESGDVQVICGVDAHPKDCGVPVYTSFEGIAERPDAIIDFSSPAALEGELRYAAERGIPAVIASTGHTPEQLEKIKDAAKKIAVFKTANFSLGVNLLTGLVKKAAEVLGENFDIEIIERHHNKKADAPSGTALMLADAANEALGGDRAYVEGRSGIVGRRGNEIGIHAVRGGTVVGKHEVMFLGTGEVITLMHESENKEVFVRGALRAAKFLMEKQSGLYDMTSIIAQNYAVTSVSSETDVALITLPRITFDGFLSLLSSIKSNDINLDMISHHYNADETVAVSFTLGGDDLGKVERLIPSDTLCKTVRGAAKITAEGAGMQHRSGVAADVLSILREAGAEVFAITTSETQISCCIDAKSLSPAEEAVKKYYGIN